MDCLSKYTYFVPVKTAISADELVSVLITTVVARYGVPERLIYERDIHFVSEFRKDLMSSFGA